jgi:UDPglucose--hexose-1-phosphate uridylyltransferase
MSEFRKDPVVDRWVIISTERTPINFPEKKCPENHPKECPFCEGSEMLTPPEILSYRDQKTKANEKGWWIRVIPNKYPILKVEEPFVKKGEGLYDKITGVGAHEIIIETPKHVNDLFKLEDKQVEDILAVYRDRILDLKNDFRFEYIMIFKNKGSRAGASIEHSHSHLIALPIVPKRITEELAGALKYFDYKGRCVFCDVIDEEIRTNKRIIYENDDFIAFCPFASRSPFEISIIPKQHESNFCNIKKSQITSCAKALKIVLEKLCKATGGADYNLILHNSKMKETNFAYYHWHISIIPRITNISGFERGTGFYINPISPEISAEYLRNLE